MVFLFGFLVRGCFVTAHKTPWNLFGSFPTQIFRLIFCTSCRRGLQVTDIGKVRNCEWRGSNTTSSEKRAHSGPCPRSNAEGSSAQASSWRSIKTKNAALVLFFCGGKPLKICFQTEEFIKKIQVNLSAPPPPKKYTTQERMDTCYQALVIRQLNHVYSINDLKCFQ